MERMIGTVSRGVRAPIIKKGDNLVDIVVDSVLKAVQEENITLHDKDVVAVTEAVVARSQGNYATIEQIAKDIENKFHNETVGVLFPILSRNRFSVCLKGIAKGCKKIVLMLSYPSDEVGNHLVDVDALDEAGINPWSDVLTLEKYRAIFGYQKHYFTGVDYVDFYKNLIEEQGCEVEIIFANQPQAILNYTPYILNCDIHTRARTKRLLLQKGAKQVYSLDDILTSSINGSGYNPQYGLLGSNKATEDSVKLFPIHCQEFVLEIQAKLKQATNKQIEVMVYGDGAFKDPVGKIWELADPVVSPGYTSGLEGTPNEVKLKYLADNDFATLQGEELKNAIKDYIAKKDKKAENLKGQMVTQGTTPRRLTDLIGSLCDLTSGSGDKGTPIILIQGYFDNYTK